VQKIFAGKVRVNHSSLDIFVPQESCLPGSDSINRCGDVLLQYVSIKKTKAFRA